MAESAFLRVRPRRAANWRPRVGAAATPFAQTLAVAGGIAVLVALLYGRSLGYGLIWDDPMWFRQGTGLTPSELFLGSPRFQYYRPLSLLYFQAWWRADGTLNVVGLHGMQLLFHLSASLLCVALAARVTGNRLVGALTGLLFAVFPFSHQAVAWAAPQQPLVTALVLAALLAFVIASGGRAGRKGDRTGREDADGEQVARRWFAMALLLYGVALLVQESAAPMWPMFAVVAVLGARSATLAPELRRVLRWTLPFAGLALIYGVLWVYAPRLEGVAGGGMDLRAAAYLLQAPAFPVARAVGLVGISTSPLALGLLLGGTTAVAAVAAGREYLGAACGSLLWIGLTLLPAWLALDYDYIGVGPRLVYAAVPGIALLWALPLARLLASPQRGTRTAGAVVAAGVVLIGVSDVRAQDAAFATGAEHIGAAIDAQRAHPGGVAFVNFPDRYRLSRAPYPLGYWGVTLAPVVTDMDEFALALDGAAPETESWAMPHVGAAARQEWPYVVDMRGVAVGPAELLQAAGRVEAIYLSEYLDDGRLRLNHVGGLARDDGAVREDPLARIRSQATSAKARFPGALELLDVSSSIADDSAVEVRLKWQVQAPLSPDETVFVHLMGNHGQVGGADGDMWGGLLPAHVWPAGAVLEDVRRMDLAREPEDGDGLTVGLYHRGSGTRRTALDSRGAPVPDGEVRVATLTAQGYRISEGKRR